MLTLLTKGESIAKLSKDGNKGYLTAVMYLASGQIDARLCPAAGACKNAALGLCLVLNSGRTAMAATQTKGPYAAKLARTKYYFDDKKTFIAQLHIELNHLERTAMAAGVIPAARLNGGSDLDWAETYKAFPNVQFWEYTKRPDLAIKLSKLPNVNVTYSFSETTTDKIMKRVLDAGVNVAVVFSTKKGKPLPATFQGRPVIDGDATDLRFLDVSGVIVGLRFKAAKDKATKTEAGIEAGFIQRAI